MSKKKKIIITLSFIGAAICFGAPIKESELQKLKSSPEKVDWLSPIKTEDSGMMIYWPAHSSKKAMKRSCRKMLYAIKNFPKSKNYPVYMMELCHNLVELEEDGLAIFWLNKLSKEPDLAKFPTRAHWMSEVKNARKKADYLLLKVYARNHFKGKALKLIASLKPEISKEYLMIAEAYAVLGMKSGALKTLKHCITSGEHIKYKGLPGPMNPGWTMNQKATTRASAAVLAFGLGNLELAKKIAAPVLNDKELKNHKWSSRRKSWMILNDIYQQKNTLSLKNLKDGTYTGSSQGYVDEVEATVIVKAGKINEIKITYNSEDRPYNAVSAIPARMKKSKNVSVDAVSGATVTCNAICMAIYKALLGAPQK